MPRVSPLLIALQEYSYWRNCQGPEDAEQSKIHTCITIGAIGAAANIAGRLASGEERPIGIEYAKLTPEQVMKALREIQLAPQMARVLLLFSDFLSKLDNRFPADDPLLKMRHAELDPLIAEFQKAGVL